MVTQDLQKNTPTPQGDPSTHKQVDIRPGMSVDDYVQQSIKLHYSQQHQNMGSSGLLRGVRSVGDMALAVIPKNRFWCSVGLTAGGFAGLKVAGILAGQRLSDNKPIAKDDVHALLRPLHGLLKYDAHSSAVPDRWKKVGTLFAFTAVSFTGVMAGAYYAYRNSRKRNSDPHNLEDYVARASQHEGDKWRWLAATSGVFGSSSGYFVAPVPGVSYGPSIAFYTVLNQDRKVMSPGLKGLSGTSTTSYLGLREGMDYICKYAVNNPAKDPAELEWLAQTVMGPIAPAAGVTLTAQNIKTFVEKIHEVRDKYYVDGGIPREKRAEALKDMEAHFKGKGLDKTLYESGIDTTKLDLTKLNGFIGKVGNKMGATSHILADQEAYRKMASEWRKEWMPAQPAPAVADDSIALASPAPAKEFARDDLKKSSILPLQRPASHQDAVAMSSGAAASRA